MGFFSCFNVLVRVFPVDSDIISIIFYIVYAIFVFLFLLEVCLFFINSSFKTIYPNIYNIIILGITILLVLTILVLYFYLNKLISTLISKLFNKLEDYILRMMAGPSNPQQPGGFGQPIGGGGKPPKKPGGFDPIKGHYQDNDSDSE